MTDFNAGNMKAVVDRGFRRTVGLAARDRACTSDGANPRGAIFSRIVRPRVCPSDGARREGSVIRGKTGNLKSPSDGARCEGSDFPWKTGNLKSPSDGARREGSDFRWETGNLKSLSDGARREGSDFRRGSMTLECTMVLPLTLMIVFVIASYMNAVALQANRCLKLSNSARKMAAIVSLAEGQTEGAWIDLFSCCHYEYPCSFLGLGGVNVAVRARVFPWVGKAPGGEEDEASSSGKETVYVTDYRSVYHTYADCTHLDLTIYETTLDKVGSLRNADGGRYRPCAGFPEDYKGPIYITKTGDCYYSTLEAAGLTRNVYMTSKDECGDLCLCSRCAERAAREAAAAKAA